MLRRRIEIFTNEAMIIAAAKIFKSLGDGHSLGITIKRLGGDNPRYDEHIQAALYEIIAFVARRHLKLAKEAIFVLDDVWIDIESAEDFELLFDSG